MEVKVLPPKESFSGDQREEKASWFVALEKPAPNERELKPYIAAYFGLVLVNHRTDRKERIRAARLELKKRRLRFWHKTLAQVPVAFREAPNYPPLRDVDVEALSTKEVECKALGDIDIALRRTLPNYSELWLVLDMYGPFKKRHVFCEPIMRTGAK